MGRRKKLATNPNATIMYSGLPVFEETKRWWQSKTQWIAVLQAGVGLYLYLNSNDPQLKMAGLALIGKSGLDGILRFFTNEPLAKTLI